MNKPLKQHLIDPEICIRCYTCEMTCPLGAIEHDDNNVVVNADLCNFCMDCIPVCPLAQLMNGGWWKSPILCNHNMSGKSCLTRKTWTLRRILRPSGRQSKTQSPRFWPRRKKVQAVERWRLRLRQNQR